MNHNNQLILLLLFTGFFVSSSGFMCQAQKHDPTNFPRQFQVQSKHIVDQTGDPVQLRGLNAFPPVWQAAGHDSAPIPWNKNIFQEMKNWGADIVRIPVHPGVWQKEGDQFTFRILDQAINWAREREMYVILDFHSIGFPPDNDYLDEEHFYYGNYYHTNRNEIQTFWQKAAKRYAGNQTVAFYELFNEPVVSPNQYPEDITESHWIQWKNFAEQLISLIRKYDTNTPVMVGGLRFGYDLSYVRDHPVQKEQVIYTTHPYPVKNHEIGWEKAFGQVAEEYPVYVSEVGFLYDDEESPFYVGKYAGEGDYPDKLINYLDRKQIGWAAWSFSTVFEPKLLRDHQFTPSRSGTFFRDTLHKHQSQD